MKKRLSGVTAFGGSKKKGGGGAAAPAAEQPQQQGTSAAGTGEMRFGAVAEADLAFAGSGGESDSQLRTENERLKAENEALRGQVHLLKFKVGLLVDMVTLANLDCDKLEDEVCARACSRERERAPPRAPWRPEPL